MSSNDNDLRERLRKVDGTADTIQGAASSMMKHYDRNTTMFAVTEWRNVLFSTTNNSSSSNVQQQQLQYLPLLYVANEVLQNSKRNRGNKFLEAFSPILQQSLIYMVQQLHAYYNSINNPNLAIQDVEKIRRVIKIWDQRRVFSTRFVNELLTALEPYRRIQHVQPQSHNDLTAQRQQHHSDDEATARFSPMVVTTSDENNTAAMNDDSHQSGISHEDILGILQAHDSSKIHKSITKDPDDDDDDLFAKDDDDNYNDDDDDDILLGNNNDGDHPSLSLDVSDVVANLGSAVSDTTKTVKNTTIGLTNKRRRRGSGNSNSGRAEKRSSTASTSSGGGSNNSNTLSNTNFLELWNRLILNQQQYDLAIHTIQQIEQHINTVSNEELENLIGDELQLAVQQNENDIKRLLQQQKVLHTLANERYTIGIEAKRYVLWLERLLQQDKDDIVFCTTLQEKIRQFIPLCQQLQGTRTILRKEQQRYNEIQQEELRRQKEKEENERFKRDVLSMQTEAKPGMVWNPTTREYQALNTEESWRD